MTKKLLVLTALSLMLAAPAALAGSRVCPMDPTPKGYEFDASGIALLTDGRSASVEAKMAAKLEDGTVLMVSATMHDGRTFDLGSFSMLLGAGEFSLSSGTERYSKAFPTSDIAVIGISLQGTTLLESTCGEKVDDRR